MKLRASYFITIIAVIVVGGVFAYVVAAARAPHVAPTSPALGKSEGNIRPKAETAPKDRNTGLNPASGPNPENSPAIELSTTKHDMGAIPNDKPSKGTLMIRNTGKSNLIISQIGTSCSCTVGSVEEKDKCVLPGSEVPMTVVVNPAHISGFESTKTLTVYSNDPKARHVSVEVTAKIEPEFAVDPRQIALGKVQKGETAKGRIVVRPLQTAPFKDRPFEVAGVKALGTPPGLTAAFSPRPEAEWAVPGQREFVVDVALDTSQVPPGDYKAMVDVETSVARVRHMPVYVTADVVAPYGIKPRPASFGLVPPGKSPAGTVTVFADRPVQVANVAISGKDLSAAPAPGPDSKSVFINVSVSPNAASGAKREQLSFTVKVGEAVYKENVQVVAVVVRNVVPAPAGKR